MNLPDFNESEGTANGSRWYRRVVAGSVESFFANEIESSLSIHTAHKYTIITITPHTFRFHECFISIARRNVRNASHTMHNQYREECKSKIKIIIFMRFYCWVGGNGKYDSLFAYRLFFCSNIL